MLRAASRAISSTASARLAAPAASATSGVLPELTLSLALPHRSLVAKKEVKRVTLPGRDGALGLEKNSPPLLTELKPGVIRVDYLDNTAVEFFVPGGFAFKHANNVCDVSAPEGVKLDQVDTDALKAASAEAAKDLAAAPAGSKAAAEAKLAQEVFKALGSALTISV